MILSWPDADDIERYAGRHGLDETDIVRDIVRIVCVAHLCEEGFLNDDCVLTGGMALRLRGSSRFTIKDTDSSMRGRLDEVQLVGTLGFREGDDLEIRPDAGDHWSRATPRLTIAKPVAYDAYFASATGDPVEGEFSFTVNQRGLFRPATRVALVHPYRELAIERAVLVPVMDIAEQAAEKVVGWAANSLVKHYLDLAWIGREFGAQIAPGDFRDLVQRKLDVGRSIYPAAYASLRATQDLILPLAAPREWRGPLNKSADNGAAQIRFMGDKMGFDEAKELVKRTIVPLLFPVKAAREPT